MEDVGYLDVTRLCELRCECIIVACVMLQVYLLRMFLSLLSSDAVLYHMSRFWIFPTMASRKLTSKRFIT